MNLGNFMDDIKVKFKFKNLKLDKFSPFDGNYFRSIAKKHELFKKTPIIDSRKERFFSYFETLGFKLIIIASFLGLFLGFWSGIVVKNIYKNLSVSEKNLEQIYSLSKSENLDLNFAKLSENISDSKNNFQNQNNEMKKIAFLKGAPICGVGIETVDHLIKSGSHTLTSLDYLLQDGKTVFSLMDGGVAQGLSNFNFENNQNLLQNFLSLKPNIDSSLKEIKIADSEMKSIPFFMQVGKIKQYGSLFDKNVPPLENVLADTSTVMTKLPKILGFDQEKTYLLIFLNNNEIRAGGGFPGSLGFFKISSGKVSDFKIQNNYTFDSNNKIMFHPLLYSSSDFPTVVQKIEDTFQKSETLKNQKIDGVITIDTQILPEILKITGPILINNEEFGYNYLLNDSNVIDILERHTKKDFAQYEGNVDDRKEILNLLTDEIFKRVPYLDKTSLLKFAGVIEKLKNEKHLMVYFEDKDIESLAQKYNASGEMKKPDGDYCLISDNNFSFSKSHQVLEENINYKVDLAQRQSELSIDYLINHEQNWKIWYTSSFTKIYLPQGANVKKYEGFTKDAPDDPEGTLKNYEKLTEDKRDGFEVFSAWEKYQPLEKKNFKLIYDLPKSVTNGKEYNLLFQKQPGLTNASLDIEVNIGNRKVKSASPAGYEISGYVVKWHSDLLQDRQFNIVFQ